MKKLFTIVAALLIHTVLVAVTPPVSDKISYQAVVRNSSNALVTNQQVGMKISILQGSATGIPMYGETHTATTNANGLISIAIGTGTPVINAFTDVDWSAGPYFIKTETDPAGGTNYTITATSELVSVPYALYSKQANQLQLPYNGLVENSNTGFSVSNLGGSAIFGKSDKTTGFAYGVMGKTISTDGTGVSGVSLSTTGLNYGVRGTVNSPDGYGVYGLNNATTGSAYGICGLSLSSSGYGVYGSGQAYGVCGKSPLSTGVGVYGLNISSYGPTYGVYGTANSPDGVGVIGVNHTTTGTSIGVMGSTASSNGFSGYFVGPKFYVNGKVGIGTSYPTSLLEIDGNEADAYARFVNDAAVDGMKIGVDVYSNVFLWNYENSDMRFGTNGSTRLAIQANGNVGIGNSFPAYKLDIGGNLNINGFTSGGALYCNGSEAIWYDGTYYSWGYGGTWNFFGDKVFIGDVAADPGTNMLVVNGAAAKSGGGSWATWSDIRLKDIQGNYEKGLNEIIRLQPIKYTYKKGNACKLPSDQNYVGFVAQDVQKVFPEAVSAGKDGYLTLDENSINVALVNAVKELKAENEQLKMTNEKYEVRLAEIENMLRELKKQ